MPAWMEFVYNHDIERFAQCAERIWGIHESNPEKAAIEGIKSFRTFLSEIGMPINFEQLGAKTEDIPVLVEKLGLEGRTGGFVELSADDVSEILHIAAKGGNL